MKKVLIFGLKKSGVALVGFLNKKCEIVVHDDDKLQLEKFEKTYGSLYDFKVLKSYEDMKNVDLAIISPGISRNNKLLEYLSKQDIKIENELDFASKFVKGEMISVTGTNGKSTVVSLINHILLGCGYSSMLAGNIGVPLTECIGKLNDASKVVVEVSSFQLEKILNHHPKIAVLLNIAPDHILWHGSFENYFNSKKNIFKFQTEEDFAVLNFDDECLRDLQTKSKKYYFSLFSEVVGCYVKKGYVYFFDGMKKEKIVSVKEVGVNASHILSNYLAAICVCKLLGVKTDELILYVKNFKALEHRYEFVVKHKGVVFINDSKATNVASTKAAINSNQVNTHLLLGGSDKGENFDELFNLSKLDNIVKAYIFGQTKNKIVESIKKFNVDYEECFNLEDSIIKAYRNAKNGEVVLLSPACASFDEFTSFEERGRFFKGVIKKIIYDESSFN